LPELVTVMIWAPVGAFAAMVSVAVIDVLLATIVLLTVTPVPPRLILDPAVKFVPDSVTSTVCPCVPELEITEVSVGAEVDPHPPVKAASRNAIASPRDHINLPAPHFHICRLFTLNNIVSPFRITGPDFFRRTTP
jgi:hypothetical protein